jgi:hypothetical protein
MIWRIKGLAALKYSRNLWIKGVTGVNAAILSGMASL